MPSAGLPIEDVLQNIPTEDWSVVGNVLITSARHAMQNGMFIEWLNSFIGAWNSTKDVVISAKAGIIEWDL